MYIWLHLYVGLISPCTNLFVRRARFVAAAHGGELMMTLEVQTAACSTTVAATLDDEHRRTCCKPWYLLKFFLSRLTVPYRRMMKRRHQAVVISRNFIQTLERSSLRTTAVLHFGTAVSVKRIARRDQAPCTGRNFARLCGTDGFLVGSCCPGF